MPRRKDTEGQRKQREFSKNRRSLNAQLGVCINNPITDRAPPHGPIVDDGVRCQKCIDVHRKSH